jgi:hypothetical protein
VVRQRPLEPPFAGSIPASPADSKILITKLIFMDNNPIQSESNVAKKAESETKPVQPGVNSAKGNALTGGLKFLKENLRTIIIVAAVVVLGILAYFVRNLVIVATVNGSPISRFEVIQKLEKASGKALLNSLITEKLVKAEAAAKNIVISDDEINGEIKKVEDEVSAQGTTLDQALAGQGMSRDDLRTEVVLRKEMEKLLGDKMTVTDQEVAQYIKDNKITVVKGDEAATNDQIKSELSSQKFSTEAQTLIAELKSKAKIQYFVNY